MSDSNIRDKATTTLRPVDDPVGDLRQLKEANSLTNADVAELCCVSVKTVESWLADKGSASFKKMPPRHLHVLRHMLPSFLAKRKAQKGRK
jgi:DNA-binding transcriptional regulator YiaG